MRGLLLFGSHGFQAMIQIGGPIPRQYLFEVRLQGTFALTYLLGAALFGCLPVFGCNLAGIDQRLGSGGSGGKQRDDCSENGLFQMSLLKRLTLAPGCGRLNDAFDGG